MTDTVEKKTILKYIREFLGKVLHIVLIPVLVVVKALIAGLTHLDTELSKF